MRRTITAIGLGVAGATLGVAVYATQAPEVVDSTAADPTAPAAVTDEQVEPEVIYRYETRVVPAPRGSSGSSVSSGATGTTSAPTSSAPTTPVSPGGATVSGGTSQYAEAEDDSDGYEEDGDRDRDDESEYESVESESEYEEHEEDD